MNYLESAWREPDKGLWEVRGDRQHFTHSKIMARVCCRPDGTTGTHARPPGPLQWWEQPVDDRLPDRSVPITITS